MDSMTKKLSLMTTVLTIDDDHQIRQSLRLCLEADGHQVIGVGTGAAALETLDRCVVDVVFLDLWLDQESGMELLPKLLAHRPDLGVIVVTAYASMESAIQAMKAGAADYLPKPFTPDQVRHGARRLIEARKLSRKVIDLTRRLHDSERELTFATRSSLYSAFIERARKAGQSDAVLLLRGESGTGKTVIARWLHRSSRRADEPFVTVHCPLLSSELMSSALFGHRKGAFTGAIADVTGKIAEAEGGSLFLDEVGDLSTDAQVRLLRFLNDRTYEPLGSAKERRADLRLITATNRSLEDAVVHGRFRDDLLYRLNVIPLVVPPLRERPEDLLDMAGHYLAIFAERQGRKTPALAEDAQTVIRRHPWLGNLRELRNTMERAVILAYGDRITAEDLGLTPAAGRSLHLGDQVSLEDVEREHLARVVAAAPSLDAATRILGIDATTLARKRKRYGLL